MRKNPYRPKVTPTPTVVAGTLAARIEEDRARRSRLRQARQPCAGLADDPDEEIRILGARQRDADATELERSKRAALSASAFHLHTARQATRLHAEYLESPARFSMSFARWKRKEIRDRGNEESCTNGRASRRPRAKIRKAVKGSGRLPSPGQGKGGGKRSTLPLKLELSG
jgi:hypothetical protein